MKPAKLVTWHRSRIARTATIFILSLSLVAAVMWFVPSLSAASLNVLFRLRGELKAPDDVVIVAIDDRSIQRIGQWPWPRSVMAGVIDRLTQAEARSIGLDIIYAEPSDPEEDRRLAAAISRSKRVILPLQLYEATPKENEVRPVTAWLPPLPPLAGAARALGHAHVSPGVDGMIRSVQLSKADDQANMIWAFGLEVVRVAERIAANDLEEQAKALRFGAHRIPVHNEIVDPNIRGVSVVRQNEMSINFVGPAGAFRYYSIADVIDGKIPPLAFANKIVLIGAVAESMGDTRAAPFMHYSAEPHQGGQEMPGVEIHANIINTIRGSLSFTRLPGWMDFAAALVVILCSALTIRWFDGWRQIVMLGLILAAITLGSLYVFSRHLIIPPLVPMMCGLVAVIPLLLSGTLAASRELDTKLATLVGSQKEFLSADAQAEGKFVDHERGLQQPQNLTWKLRAVDDLTTELLSRMSFFNRVLSSMGEGVLVADLAGRVVFANREAARLFDAEQDELPGENFANLLIARGVLDRPQIREALRAVATGQQTQLEFEVSPAEPRHYSLLLSALVTDNETMIAPVSPEYAVLNLLPTGNVIGVVALISDITKHVELDRIKTETLQLVSHELRAPLTSIQGLSDVLIKFPVAADDAHEMLDTIHAEAVRLGETINRYLDLARLESRARLLQLAPIDCQQLIVDCVRHSSLLAEEQRINLISQISPDLPPFQADAQLLTQAINNLLSNAIKYSPPHTEVVVAADVHDANISISVRDQGFGVPEKARERIFEKFYRLERDTAAGIVGTGLGLPLVKEIVDQHHGRITVESAPLAGCTFTIYLPLHQPALPV